MDAGELERRARTFERGAAEYDRLRPEFPAELFDAVMKEAGPRFGGRILEIGAGTGRATLPLARRGARIEVVEPSGDMLDVLAGRLDGQGLTDRVLLRQARFEDVDPGERYDVVVAAQSFHWADGATRWSRLASLIRAGGRAFMFWNGWFLDPAACDTDGVADAYRRFGGELQPDLGDPHPTSGWAEQEVAAEPDLTVMTRRTYAWPWHLSLDDYIGLLAATSQYVVAPVEQRTELFTALRSVLDETVVLGGRTLHLTIGRSRGAG